jgi:hypothetical protein
MEPFIRAEANHKKSIMVESLQHETVGAMRNEEYLADLEYSELRKIHANRKAIIKTIEKSHQEFITYLSKPLYRQKPGALRKRIRAINDAGMPKDTPRLLRYPSTYEYARTRAAATVARFHLLRTTIALERYRKKRMEYPQRLVELVPKYTDRVAIDPFSGRALRYYPKGGKYLLFSVGPDLTSHSGTIPYNPTNGLSSRGDIYFEHRPKREASANSNMKPQGTASDKSADGSSELIAVLKKAREDSGKDNALIYYFEAMRLEDIGLGKMFQENRQILDKVRREGWSSEAEVLLPCFEKCKPITEMMRKGVQVEQAYWPESIKCRCPGREYPKLNRLQIYSILMMMQGMYYESQSQYQEALDNYCMILVAGHHLGTRYSPMLCKLYGYGTEGKAAKRLVEMLQKGNLQNTELVSLASVLQRVEGEYVPFQSFVAPMIGESLAEFEEVLRQGNIDALGALRISDAEKQRWMKNPDIPLKGLRELNASLEKYFRKPYPQREDGQYESIMKTAEKNYGLPEQKGIIGLFYGTRNVEIRSLSALTELRIVIAMNALERYRLKRGVYPKTLAELTPDYLKNIPKDPFADRSLRYYPRGSGYLLFSVGPDRSSHSGQVLYEPRNGIDSQGDIYFAPRK